MPLEMGISLTLAALRKPLEDLYGAARGAVRTKLKILTSEAKLKTLYKNITGVQKVKTMWQIDKEVKLLTFYYPSRVSIGDTTRTINAIEEIAKDHNFVIQGTVGQGKSIFLRFLCIKELAASKRIPIFVELRRYEPKKSFRQYLISALVTYGFPHDEEMFDYLAASGKLVLLLDAFDEIEPDSVTVVLSDIETIAQTYPSLQIIITSRYDSGIERSSHFRVYRLAPLQPADHKPFLEKIIVDKPRVSQILSAIASSSGEIKSLLQTPLLLTLLVIVYNATQGIPSSLSAFYDELFHTLITRHDNTKPGFKRRRATRLNDSDLKRLFEAFCYSARQQDLLVLTDSALAVNLNRASAVTGIPCNPDEFAKDITKAACLMQQEGFQYHFIHKSVAEFHAASFIAHASEENAHRFYEGVRKSKWNKWRQELVFLSQIDRYRYLRYFFVPSAQEALVSIGVDLQSISEPVSISEDQMRDRLNRNHLHFDPGSPPKSTPSTHMTIAELINYCGYELEVEYLNKLFPLCMPNMPTEKMVTALGDFIDRIGKREQARALVDEQVNLLRSKLTAANEELERELKMGEFVNP